MEYTLKKQQETQKTPVYEEGDLYRPHDLALVQSETATEAINRILYNSGAISREQWERVMGIGYDAETDFLDDDDFSEEDDEYEQSTYATYEIDRDFIDDSPNQEIPKGESAEGRSERNGETNVTTEPLTLSAAADTAADSGSTGSANVKKNVPETSADAR